MIKSLLENDYFFHRYQPIYDIKQSVKIGYEGLFRTSCNSNPETTFITAKKEKQLFELDSRSIHKAASTYRSAGFTKKDGLLFLNIFPSTITNNKFPSFIKQIMDDSCRSSQQIVLEISESEKIIDFELYRNAIHFLKSEGFLIALDDIGKGYTDFKSIIEVEPDYIKLDKYFAENLDSSFQKQAIIQLFLKYCEDTSTNLILEGIETDEEVAIAKSLGVTYAQGYRLGKPEELQKTY